jgi:aspartate-semialdehyde dehydrogenase
VTRIAIVHPNTLLGKEILERLAVRPELTDDLRLLSDDPDEIGTVLDAAGAAALVTAIDDGFDGVDLALFTGAAADDARAAERLGDGTLAVFASAGGAPADAPAAIAGFAAADRLGVSRLASAHPAAVALAHLLSPLRALGLRRAHATVVLPVSMQGSAGIDTLFDETRSLLTFSEQKKKSQLYPAQVAFNLLPATEAEAAVEQQLAAALGAAIELSVGLAQAGVFHGLAVSAAVELDAEVDRKAVERALDAAPQVERPRDPKKIGSAAAAGEENLLVGAVRASGPGRFRLWAAMDNLVRGAALNSLDLAAELIAAGRPS